jgi:hypothetical protein
MYVYIHAYSLTHTHTHTHKHTHTHLATNEGAVDINIYISPLATKRARCRTVQASHIAYIHIPPTPTSTTTTTRTHLAANEGAVENSAGLAYVLLRNKKNLDRQCPSIFTVLFSDFVVSCGNILGICNIFRICATVTRYYFQNLLYFQNL